MIDARWARPFDDDATTHPKHCVCDAMVQVLFKKQLRSILWLILTYYESVQALSRTAPPHSMGMMMYRRQWLSCSAATITAALLQPTQDAFAADGELPMALRSFTKLASLSSSSSKSSSTSSIRGVNNSNKSLHLPISELAARLQRDLTNGATGQGSYIATGDLSLNFFRDDCSFIDPTNRVDDLLQYQKALTILFDPATSKVDLLEPLRIVKDDHTTRTTTIVLGRYRCRGTLKLPWKPLVAAFESHCY